MSELMQSRWVPSSGYKLTSSCVSQKGCFYPCLSPRTQKQQGSCDLTHFLLRHHHIFGSLLNFWPVFLLFAFLSHWHPLVFCLPATLWVLLLLSALLGREAPHKEKSSSLVPQLCAVFAMHVGKETRKTQMTNSYALHRQHEIWWVSYYVENNLDCKLSYGSRWFFLHSVSILHDWKFCVGFFWCLVVFFFNNLNIWFGLELSFICPSL